MTNTGKLRRRMHVKVRRRDQLVEKGYSRDGEPGENSVPVLLVFNRGRRGTQGTNFTGKTKQQENKEPLPAVLTTWAFIPELPWKQQNRTHKQWKWTLTWTGFETSQASFTVSTRPTTEQHRNVKARPTPTWRGTANPKCLTCSRAKRCKRREVAPTLPQRASHTAGFTRRARIDNTRLTGGIHFDSTSFRVNTPDKLTGKAGGKEENQWTRVGLDARFLGSHWVQVLLTLDQGLDLEGHKSRASSVSQGIQLSGALYCIVWLRPKSIYVLFFPVFNRSNSIYSGQSIPKPGPKQFKDSFLKQHRKILGWPHKQTKGKTSIPTQSTKRPAENVRT